MPASKHRRRGKSRPCIRQEPTPEFTLTPKGRHILELTRERLTEIHGKREWTREEFSTAMFSFAYDFTPDVERTSIDEDYFDLTVNRKKPAVEIALIISKAIRQSLKIPAGSVLRYSHSRSAGSIFQNFAVSLRPQVNFKNQFYKILKSISGESIFGL